MRKEVCESNLEEHVYTLAPLLFQSPPFQNDEAFVFFFFPAPELHRIHVLKVEENHVFLLRCLASIVCFCYFRFVICDPHSSFH